VGLAAVGAATWPMAEVLFERLTAMPLKSGSQAPVEAPHGQAVNAAPAVPSPVDDTAVNKAVQTAPEDSPAAASLPVQAKPTAGMAVANSRRQRPSGSTRQPHPKPLRGYAWSATANALVPIDGEFAKRIQ